MDDDVEKMNQAALVAEVKRLRAAIREHRDSSGRIFAGITQSSGACCQRGPQHYQLCPGGRNSCAGAFSIASHSIASFRKPSGPTRSCKGRVIASGLHGERRMSRSFKGLRESGIATDLVSGRFAGLVYQYSVAAPLTELVVVGRGQSKRLPNCHPAEGLSLP